VKSPKTKSLGRSKRNDLRDQFAGQAMQALIAHWTPNNPVMPEGDLALDMSQNISATASLAYLMADAMMAAREGEQ
jgi:hypothetical protein